MKRVCWVVARVVSHLVGALPWRVLLRIPAVGRWFRAWADGFIFGAMPDADKLCQELRLAAGKKAGKQVELWLGALSATPVRMRIKCLPRIRLSRKFIIALVDMPQSMQGAQRCLESAAQHGEAQHLRIMPAVDKFHSEAFFREHGLTCHKARCLPADPLAVMGCFSSHYKLWLYCVETQSPIVVLEHDIEFIGPLPALRFKDIICLASKYEMPGFSSPRMLETYHAHPHLLGTHAYAVTPEGAQKLIDQARRRFLPPVDIFMCKRHVEILECAKPPVKLVPRFSTIKYLPINLA